jgi:hypothetical protein
MCLATSCPDDAFAVYSYASDLRSFLLDSIRVPLINPRCVAFDLAEGGSNGRPNLAKTITLAVNRSGGPSPDWSERSIHRPLAE